MSTQTAMNTGAMWDAVKSQPLDEALQKLERDGWAKIASSEGGLAYIVLIREKKTVSLYARNSVVGMIHVANKN